MSWGLTQTQWWFAEQYGSHDDQPVEADTLIYEGAPVGFKAGSTPANLVRTCAAGDAFAGFALRTVDNSTAGAANPNLLNFPNVGTGLAAGAKCRVKSRGRIRLNAARTPDTSGTLGGITGLAGTQADVNTVVYFNGTGFTTTSTSNTKVGTVVAVGTTNTGGVYWEIEFAADPVRTA
jgi:hypothetical protein